jgi:RNA 3'-terminal phosphate cyclase (ATP)
MHEPVTINGSAGGGQMLRNAVALSAVSGHAVRVVNIRGARPQPGLRPQHLMAVRAVAEVCNAALVGAEIGSREIEFRPGEIASKTGLRLDVGTAGSVLLVLQSLVPALGFAGSHSDLTVIGGTDVPFAPPFDHFAKVFLPALAEIGPRVEATLVCRGFYPKGGGEVRVRVQPSASLVGQELVSCPVRFFNWLERGGVRAVQGKSYSQGLPAHVAERMRDAAVSALREGMAGDKLLPNPVAQTEIDLEIVPKGPSEGCGIVLWAGCEGGRRFGGSALGRRGKRAEEVGAEAAHALLAELAGEWAVESHLADQMIVWMALADGPSEFTTRRLTDHIRNAAIVAEAITGVSFTLEEGAPARVRCDPPDAAGRGGAPQR